MYLINWLSNIKINEYDIATVLMNISLAVLPFLFCYYLNFLWEKNKGFKNSLRLVNIFIVFILWLVFIPNTAYLITDVRHITGFCTKNYYNVCIENSWMIFFFFSYALIGWIMFVFSLNQMKDLIKKIKNNAFSNYFILLIIPIIALGVMVGLIDRYNSWNIFLSPINFFKDGLKYFIKGIYLKNYLAVTFFLYILYFLGNLLFKNEKINFILRKL
jgi:uncharacterized membrane protein